MGEQLRQEKGPEEITEMREKNAAMVWDDYLRLQEGERVLFINDARAEEQGGSTDPELIEILKGQLIARGVKFAEISADEKTKWEELEEKIRDGYNVVWNSWGMEDVDDEVDFQKIVDLLEKEAGKEREEDKKTGRGARMAFCPNMKANCLDDGGPLSENMDQMNLRMVRMAEILNRGAAEMKITTSYGTDLRMAFKQGERQWLGVNGVIRPGGWDNLPGGEVFTTPWEQSVEGKLVLPVLSDDISKEQGVDEFVVLTIVGGVIRNIEGGKSAKKLRKYLEKEAKKEHEEKRGGYGPLFVAEMAFGANFSAPGTATNPKGDWREPGNAIILSEKSGGGIHIAFGNSKHDEEGTDGLFAEAGIDPHLDFVIPPVGLTVEMFKKRGDIKRGKKGIKLIDSGEWRFLSV